MSACRHQFPQPPTPLGKGRIPAWQQPQPTQPEQEQPEKAQLPVGETETGPGMDRLGAQGKYWTEPLAEANGQGESSDDADRDDGLD